jgi:hypothetical protein
VSSYRVISRIFAVSQAVTSRHNEPISIVEKEHHKEKKGEQNVSSSIHQHVMPCREKKKEEKKKIRQTTSSSTHDISGMKISRQPYGRFTG